MMHEHWFTDHHYCWQLVDPRSPYDPLYSSGSTLCDIGPVDSSSTEPINEELVAIRAHTEAKGYDFFAIYSLHRKEFLWYTSDPQRVPAPMMSVVIPPLLLMVHWYQNTLLITDLRTGVILQQIHTNTNVNARLQWITGPLVAIGAPEQTRSLTVMNVQSGRHHHSAGW